MFETTNQIISIIIIITITTIIIIYIYMLYDDMCFPTRSDDA